MVLNDNTDARRPEQTVSSSTPSEETPNRSRHKFSHSLPASPMDTHISPYSLNSRTDLDMSLAGGLTSELRVDPDNSGLSKHLPELSTDLSLLIDEQPPPDTASQSDHVDSQVSVMNRGSSNSEPHQGVSCPPSFPKSPTQFGRHDQTQRGDIAVPQGLTSVNEPTSNHELGKSGPFSSSIDASMESTASFDLSSARLSLDLIRQGFGEDWAKSVMVESSSAPSADTSQLLPTNSLMGGDSGPITSTPFRSPSASPLGSQHKEPDVSFNLDALDPDLVALLRPNNNQRPSPMDHIVTLPLEPFAPPPDPLNPGTTAKRPIVPASPPVPPSLSTVPTKREASTPSPTRKFATISASQSPARQLRLPRSYTAQDIFPPSKLPNPPLAATTAIDLHWQDNPRHDEEQPSPTSAMTSSDILTPSDVSKQPSPLSAMPLTLDDLQRHPGSNAIQSPTASTSTLNITTRHKARPAPIQSPSPVSTLTSSVDSRPSAYYVPRSRDRDFGPNSVSPEIHALYPHTFGSTGRERDRIRPSLDGLFSKRPGPHREAVRPGSADAGLPPGTFPERSNGTSVLSHSRDRNWESSVARRYRKRSMSLDQRYSGVDGRADDFHSQGVFHQRFRGPRDREGVAESVAHSGSEYAYSVTTGSGLGTPYDGRDVEREREPYGYGYGERERSVRPHTDWLGPRTVKAFAAAGLLDDARDAAGSK